MLRTFVIYITRRGVFFYLPGIAAQGRSFKLRNVTDNGVGSFAGGHGEPGPLVAEKGTLSYFEVSNRILYRLILECY